MKSSPSECISVADGHIAKTVLMPGDPLRAQFIAENYLENPVCFNSVRNMLGYTGTYKGTELSVMGHGMGCPSAALYAHELFNFFDVEAIIRIGSAGALADDVHLKDVVLAMSAATNSNFVTSYDIPGTLAPTADWTLLKAAFDSAKELGIKTDVGSIYTTDFFYDPKPDTNEKIREMGLLCVDMETAGIYLTAMNSHKKALSILSISNHIISGESLTAVEIKESFRDMMEIALETAIKTV